MKKNTFGKALRNARFDSNQTLFQVSTRTRYSVAHLSDFERGERAPPSGESIVELATAVGSSAADLLLAAASDRGEFRCPLSLVNLDELSAFLRAQCLAAFKGIDRGVQEKQDQQEHVPLTADLLIEMSKNL